ncbi:hypothetical protein [Mycobacterium avium]|uniref:hypothetical protein n=1 Tax=Mycobacterium avium TaxID=1764 RepID=UPI001CC7841D|nr:hypothetical protein [Mycobacterium avium]
MTTEERARLRAAGRAKAALLPPISPESGRRVAELLRYPVNEYLKHNDVMRGAA